MTLFKGREESESTVTFVGTGGRILKTSHSRRGGIKTMMGTKFQSSRRRMYGMSP